RSEAEPEESESGADNGSDNEAEEGPDNGADNAGSEPGTTDNKRLVGAPDLTVQLLKNPHIFLIIGEMKKLLTKMAKIRLMGWRKADRAINICNRSVRNSQIAQLLFY
ncbi:hypothetical protein GBAR_LOCUS17255, partial [Geodia barretti]